MPKTLLLADDSVTIQKVVGLSFANEELNLVTVDNGDDALTQAREIKPDIILADVVMPGLDGYEVCEAVNADEALKHIPVLLLSGTFEPFDEARAKQVGALGHITKPFEAQALVERVNEILSDAGTEAEAIAEPEVTAPGELTQAFDTALMGDEDPYASTQDFSIEPPRPVVQLDADQDFSFADNDDEANAFILPDEEDPLDTSSADFVDFPDLNAESTDSVPDSMDETIAFLAEDNSTEVHPSPESSVAPVASLDDDWGDTSHDFSHALEDSTFATAVSDPSLDSFSAVEEDTGSPVAEDATFVMPDGFELPESAAPISMEIDEEPMVEPAITFEEPPALEPLDLTPPAIEFCEEEADIAPDFGGVLEEPWETANVSTPAAETVAEPAATISGADLLTPEFQQQMHETLEKMAWEAFSDVSEKLVKDALQRIEAVAWEVIPQMAESLIKEEISKLKGE
jgi:CheY-like chemotaxis protein